MSCNKKPGTVVIIFCIILIVSCTTPLTHKQPEIVIGVWNVAEKDILEKVIQEYPSSRDLPIRIEAVNGDIYPKQLSSYILSKSNTWDIALSKSEWVPQWIQYNALHSFGSNQTIKLPGMEDFTVDGKIYALPISGDIPVLWYRKDWFSEANLLPPATWADVYQAAVTLSNPPTRYGLTLANENSNLSWDFLHLFVGFGGNIQIGDKKIDFSSQEGDLSLSYLMKLRNEGLTPPLINGGVSSLEYFRNGQSGMAILWASQVTPLFDCQEFPELCDQGISVIAGTLIPTKEIGMQTSFLRKSMVLVIPIAANHPVEAGDFIMWLASTEGQAAWTRASGLPSNYGSHGSNPAKIITAQNFPMGISLDVFRLSDNFFNQVNRAILSAVEKEQKPTIVLQEINTFLEEDLNRTENRP